MLTGVLAGLAAGALWGLVFVAPRMIGMGEGGYTSMDLTAGRFMAYGAMAVAVMLLTRLRRGKHARLPTFRQAVTALGLSVLGFTGYYLLLVLAVREAGTEVPTLVIGTIPIWVMLLGKPRGLRWQSLVPGLLLTLAGLVLMMQTVHAGLEGPGGAAVHFWRGVLFVVLSMLSWTAFAVINSAWLKRHPEVNATDWANWLGVATGLSAIVMWLVAGSGVAAVLSREDRLPFLLICVTTGIGSAWFATILWNIASQRLSASLCGQLIVSETMFALLYSFLWDGRWPSMVQLFACALFAAGIVASIRAHRHGDTLRL